VPQVRTITTSVAGPKFREQGAAVEEFWRRMAAANGGRPGDPRDYISLVDVHWEEGRGWVIEYEVPAELQERTRLNLEKDIGIKVELEYKDLDKCLRCNGTGNGGVDASGALTPCPACGGRGRA